MMPRFARGVELRPRSSISALNSVWVSTHRWAAMLITSASISLLAGCDHYPPAEDVASCAAARFGTQHGAFNIAERTGSMFSAREYTITYRKAGSPDFGVVVYYRRRGPVTTQVEISYGNHAEIAGAVDAIKYCAQPR
jgi:hypothetical protein